MVLMSFVSFFDKELLYDRYTLPDSYKYQNINRMFQWDKIKNRLQLLDSLAANENKFGVVANYKNWRGVAPLVVSYSSKKGYLCDSLGTPRSQSAPLYDFDSPLSPSLYCRDGSIVELLDSATSIYTISLPEKRGKWFVPRRYVHPLNIKQFNKAIVVDCLNQNIATLERDSMGWLIRSMNPVTTGVEHPPYRRATPLGIYVTLQQREKMYFHKDGSHRIGGFAPYATRFSAGGYIHGVPVNSPDTAIIEYSNTLGTTPSSHMCVRSATSHAKFIYNWAEVGKCAILIIE